MASNDQTMLDSPINGTLPVAPEAGRQAVRPAPDATHTSLFDQPATRISAKWWALWLVGFGIFSMLMPRDASYDVVHYHLFNGWSALNGEGAENLAPAEMHSFLNPVWQIFVWLLIDLLPGRGVAFILGVLQGLGLPILYALTRRVLLRSGAQPAMITVMAIAVAGFSAEGQFGMIATVRNDAVFAILLLGALALIIPDDRPTPTLTTWATASFLVGAIMGIKLTTAVYGVFFATTAIIIMPDWQTRLRAGAVCAVAGLGGLLLFALPWGLAMWDAFGNPIFPNLNAYFDAPLGPDTAFRDTRNLPHGFTEALLRPFLIFFDGGLINGAREHFVDPRLQISYLFCFAVPITLLFGKGRNRPGLRTALALSAGTFLSITAWTLMFSFSRYMAAAWFIGPTLLALFIALLEPKWLSDKRAPIAALIAAGILFFITEPFSNRRVPWTSWTERYVEATLPGNTDYSNAIIAFSGSYPSAYLAPYFPDTALLTHLVPAPWSTPALANYRVQIRAAIHAGDRPLYIVAVDGEGHLEETIERLKQIESIEVAASTCTAIETPFATPEMGWKICPATVLPQ